MRWLATAVLAAATSLVHAETPMLALSWGVEFDTKSSVIRPDQALELQEFVCRLSGHGYGRLFVTGESSDEERHLPALSASREASVRIALEKLGFDPSRFSKTGGPSTEVRQSTPAAKGRNLRRVTLFYNGGALRSGAPSDCTPVWQRQLRAVGDGGAASISRALVRNQLMLPGPILVHVIKEERPGLLQSLLSPAQGPEVFAADRDEAVREAARSERLDLLSPLIAMHLPPLRPALLAEALTLACRQPDMVRALIARGAPLQSTSWQADPLYCAASAGNLDSVNLLLAAGASPNLSGGRIVLIGHRTAIVHRLIAAGADPRVKLAPPESARYNRLTLFHSYQFTTPDDVRWLAGLGLDINETTPREQTPLGIAANYATDDVLDAMLASGAMLIEPEGWGLVGHAERNPTGQLWLMRHGASVQGSGLLLMLLSRHGQIDPSLRLPVIREAVARGANVNARDHRGQSVLAAAIQAFNVEAVELLLQAGADTQVAEPGLSALDLARRPKGLAEAWRVKQQAIVQLLEASTAPAAAAPAR